MVDPKFDLVEFLFCCLMSNVSRAVEVFVESVLIMSKFILSCENTFTLSNMSGTPKKKETTSCEVFFARTFIVDFLLIVDSDSSIILMRSILSFELSIFLSVPNGEY